MNAKLLIVLSTVMYGVWGFTLKKALGYLPPMCHHIVFTAAGLVLLPVYFGIARSFGVVFAFPLPGVAWAISAAVACGVGSVALIYAVKAGDASSTIALTASYPIVTMVLSALFLNEALTLPRVAGILLIGCGAVLLSR